MVDQAETKQLEPTMVGSKAASKACNMFNCFDVYRFVARNYNQDMYHADSRAGAGWLEGEVSKFSFTHQQFGQSLQEMR